MTTADTIREIEELKYRYLRAVDTRDWNALADTLTDDVVTDYGTQMGGKKLAFTSRDAVLDYFRGAMKG
ncbi:MAG: nuclear transport factor 2 family protein, partial [Gordonia sp. (in: high G+C Gram-positive bacteria)]|nr:nuclear transport factor 2 family protein [Gordonia sp. (in: high G+C Gram-positive bacteria)]